MTIVVVIRGFMPLGVAQFIDPQFPEILGAVIRGFMPLGVAQIGMIGKS